MSAVRKLDEDLNIWPLFKYSVMLHVSIVLVFTIKAFFHPGDLGEYAEAVRVDLVALPDKKLPDPSEEIAQPDPQAANLPPQAVHQKKIETPPTTKTVNLKNDKTKVTKKTDAALERLKALQALEEDMKKEQAENILKAAAATKPAGAVKGNILAAGTALKGLNRMDYEAYKAALDKHVKRNWLLPEWIAKGSFKARAIVYFDARGNVIKRQLMESSKNSTYDELVLEAIDKASPFPVPPEKFSDIVSQDGVVFGFPE